MKVNITYSIELDRIPFELAKRFVETKSTLQDALDWFDIVSKDLEECVDPRVIFTHSEKIRERLANVDQAVAEHTTILAEYQRATAELFLAKQEASQSISQSTEPQKNQQLEADIAESQSSEEEEKEDENG